jgi:hypothetical protein
MAEVILNAAWVGRIAEETVGLTKLTKDFNAFRRSNMKDYKPAKAVTVKRYNGGYNKTTTLYRKFLAQYVALI